MQRNLQLSLMIKSIGSQILQAPLVLHYILYFLNIPSEDFNTKVLLEPVFKRYYIETIIKNNNYTNNFV